MFGISWGEFLVIIIVAVAVIPARDWPAVARATARLVKFMRNLVWQISDATETIREQIDLERPIDEISRKTLAGVRSAFSSPINHAERGDSTIQEVKKKKVKINRAVIPAARRGRERRNPGKVDRRGKAATSN